MYLGKRTRNFNVILDSKGPMEIHYRTISFCMLQKVLGVLLASRDKYKRVSCFFVSRLAGFFAS